MLIIDGYSIEQFPKQNKVVINLPQTIQTAISSAGVISDRKIELNNSELAAILTLAKMCFESNKQ